MANALKERTVLPPADPAPLARFARGLNAGVAPARARLVGADGVEIEIPDELYGVLLDVVGALSQGLAITIALHNTMLTTQEAADLLGISRPTLVRLLTEGEIPHSMRAVTVGCYWPMCSPTGSEPAANGARPSTTWPPRVRRPVSTTPPPYRAARDDNEWPSPRSSTPVSSTPAYLCDTLLRLAEAETLIESMTNDALHPDDFLLDQLDLHPGATIQALRDQAAAYRREPTTVAGLLGRLERSGLQGFAAEVRRHLP